MARHSVWLTVALFVCALPATANTGPALPEWQGHKSPQKSQPQQGQQDRRKWWVHDRAELGITEQQSAQIDEIFESTVPRLRELRKELDKLEDALSTTIKAHMVDAASLAAQLDKVEAVRAEHSKTRTLMLYRMHLVLSADQRAKLRALRERQESRRRDKDPIP